MTAGLSNVGAIIKKVNTDLASQTTIMGISPVPLPPNAFDGFPVDVAGTPAFNVWITVQEISANYVQNLSGSSGVGPCLIQLNVWCPDYEYADNLRRRVNAILEGFSGTINGDYGSAIVQGGNHRGNFELYDGQRKIHQLITRWLLFMES